MKQSVVQTVPCTTCKRGEAVNKEQAVVAFHSKPYAKKRKALRKVAPKATPQVSRAITVEHLLTSPKLPEAFALSKQTETQQKKADEKEEDRFIRNMIYLAGLVVGLVAVYFEVELATFKLLFLITVIGLFLIWVRADDVRLDRQLQYIVARRQSWICLRCGHEWTDTSSDQKQSDA